MVTDSHNAIRPPPIVIRPWSVKDSRYGKRSQLMAQQHLSLENADGLVEEAIEQIRRSLG